ncbi:MAG TPA: DUF1697 domain-containing protein [Hanamia sp.]|nr:DUF1697 domain-containing protein [Hanamia sp.]
MFQKVDFSYLKIYPLQTFISILRGINVSGQKKILMADLKALYESLRFKDIATYIQSGNVVFKSNEKITDLHIAKKIEEAIFKNYNFQVPVIVRSSDEMKKIVSSNPFLKQKNIDVKKLHVTFLSEIPAKTAVETIENIDFSPDQFVISGKEIYLRIPESYGETKLSNQFFEKKLKVSATTRNWNTVMELMEMSSA